MSHYDSDSSGEEKKLKAAKKAAKKQKKEKKDKKKSDPAASNVEKDNETPTTSASKKRKREIIPDEIEIDVNLPEPASKKAARKAKKAKTRPTTTTTTTTNNNNNNSNAAIADSTTATTSDTGEPGTAATDASKRSEHSVWIGNLPWTATKDLLLTFLTTHAEIQPSDITRIHMPAPKAPPRPNWTTAKPQNKGFAYVDFATELAMYSAIALTETRMDNRPLLIKNSKNFEGRPDKPKEGGVDHANGTTTYAAGASAGTGAGADTSKATKRNGSEANPPNHKIFVGNLAFETTKDDLETHFAPCGPVQHIHMATFEDSGKSKGFAWVTFADVEAATCAVRGFVVQKDDAGKKKKWKLNKLMGRDLRCEFAEDGTTRYQKRFGGGGGGTAKRVEEGDEDDVHASRRQRPVRSEGKGGSAGFKPRAKVDPRSIAPGKAHASAPRASAAIVKSKGKKTTFD